MSTVNGIPHFIAFYKIVLTKIFFCPIWAIRKTNAQPVNICFSTIWTTWSLSLEWHLSLCHFLFDTSSPMRHSWVSSYLHALEIFVYSPLLNNIFFQQRNLLAILAKRESTNLLQQTVKQYLEMWINSDFWFRLEFEFI